MPDIERNGGPPLEADIDITPELVQFIENIGLYYERFGFPRIGGRILGLLLAARAPISAEQIAAALQVSRGSVSTNVRFLTIVGLATLVTKPGDRRDYYTVAPTAWERAIASRIEGMQGLRAIAEQGLAALPAADPARANLEGLRRWTILMEQGDVNALEAWRRGWNSIEE